MRKKNKKIKSSGEKIPVTVIRGSADVLQRLALLNKAQPHAVLATVSDNMPYTSIVAYALTPDLKGLIFATPRNTQKYRNMSKNKHVAFLIDSRSNTAADYMKAESITIIGIAHLLKRSRKRDELMNVLLKKHPKLMNFAQAPSTSLITVQIRRCIHVNSFQIATEISIDL